MVAIINYGVGNLFSIQSSLNEIGVESIITDEVGQIEKADRLILPGVGAFEDAMAKLVKSGLKDVVIQQANAGKPLLGICLGMQMLFEWSEEYGHHEGLALLKGHVVSMEGVVPKDFKIPQMGWNSLQWEKASPLHNDVPKDSYVYYVHSYYAVENAENLLAWSDYGVKIPGLVGDRNVFGAQFHPEKSGEVGLKILQNFTEIPINQWI